MNGSTTLLSCSVLYLRTMLCLPIQSNKPEKSRASQEILCALVVQIMTRRAYHGREAKMPRVADVCDGVSKSRASLMFLIT
ncbi:hypothetical protein B0I37DRAFT_227165 [Chaetomium sp. MPI-CAGE-AT-0009]|nr:hypothetical protein B0I37DRAFT_227165 [Chaetomium sp. MPI-CAGE-AT-0009]